MFVMEELRYPFTNILEFIDYSNSFSALPLLLGLVFFFIGIAYAFRLGKYSLVCLYFAFSFYNNPAYQIFGLSLFEICGISSILFSRSTKLTKPSYLDLFPIVLCLILLYTLFVDLAGFSPVEHQFGNRVAVFGKAIVFYLNAKALLSLNESYLTTFYKLIFIAMFGASVVYLSQIILWSAGVNVYGTYLSAGLTAFPSFGSVSIERGHFAKFYNPLIGPLIFLLYRKIVSKFEFSFMIAPMLLNLSATGYAYILLFATIYLVKICKNWFFYFAILVVTVFALYVYFPLFASLADKIIYIGFLGEECDSCGRSIDRLLEYLTAYPMGIGYGGSSLRNVDGLSEINLGFYIFISQLSIFGLFLLLPLVWIYYAKLNTLIRVVIKSDILALYVSAAVMPILFMAESLWFVPSIWLGYLLLVSEFDQILRQDCYVK